VRSALRRKRPGHYHHGDLRRALIDAALRLIEEEGGVAAVTTRALARRLGVSHAAPAYHFRDREALLAEVATEGFRVFADALEAAAHAEPDPHARFCAVGLAYVRFAIGHPSHLRVMFGRGLPEGLPDGHAPPPALLGEGARAYQVLLDASSALVASSPTPIGSVDEVAFAAWSLVHGMAVLWNDGPARQAFASRELFEQAAARIIGRSTCGAGRQSGRRAGR